MFCFCTSSSSWLLFPVGPTLSSSSSLPSSWLPFPTRQTLSSSSSSILASPSFPAWSWLSSLYQWHGSSVSHLTTLLPPPRRPHPSFLRVFLFCFVFFLYFFSLLIFYDVLAFNWVWSNENVWSRDRLSISLSTSCVLCLFW